ncbi:glycosyltransferase family 2 protein [Leeuwenhoekiella aequorea]|uniref:Glycosyltransferase involved in cell wall biosynthesis n=1 Tax=Leeuwenhoekiella aequorea TaxID=283736 RepID=A0A4Q0PFG9_9FLAO|nr:glycosyltransferase [Leeuwenhoekiella aequorea]RXG24899.1 glycosyltransferase involved in cell wall biosynthesis [Leeuwenhoekiella aequorea]
MKPLISIILPTFNGQKYLELAIISILNQTYQNFELIIVDDFSSDSTPQIIEKYLEIDSRIKAIRNPKNLNLPTSLNKGHCLAKGAYMTWTSDDNILKVNFLECLLLGILKTDVDVIYSNFEIVDHSNNFIRINKVGTIDRLPFENVIGASFLYKSIVFTNIQYRESLSGIEDYDFWIRAAQSYKFKIIKDVLYKYRIHTETLTYSLRNDRKQAERFEDNLKVVIDNLNELSYASKVLLFNFHCREGQWNWDFFLKNRGDFEKEYLVWLNTYGIKDLSVSKRYLSILRELLLQTNSKKIILKLLCQKPTLLSSKFSSRTTLKLLKKLF